MLKKDLKNNEELLLRKYAAKGEFNAVQEILNRNEQNINFNINAQSSNGNTALHWACFNAVEIYNGYSEGHSKTIQFLIRADADHRIKNNLGKLPYHFLQTLQLKITRSESLLPEEARGNYCYFTLINELLRIECAKITSPEELEGELASATAFYLIIDSLKLFDFFPPESEYQDTLTILSIGCGFPSEILPLMMYFEYQNKKINYIGINNKTDVINDNKVRYAAYENVELICADMSNLDEISTKVSQSIDLGIMRNGDFTEHRGRCGLFSKIVDQVFPNMIKPECPLLITFQTEYELEVCCEKTQILQNFKKFKSHNFSDTGKLCYFYTQYLNRTVITYPDRFSVILNLDKTNSDQALLSDNFKKLRM